MANFQKSARTLTEVGIGRAHLSRTEVGMAHFSGTGNTAEKCKTCSFLIPMSDRSKKKKCRKFETMTGDARKSISGNAYVCKYFEVSK